MFFRDFLMVCVFLGSVLCHGKDPVGWLWYKEPLKGHRPLKPNTPPKKPQTALERLSIFQKHFEEVKAKAVLNPSLENVRQTRRLHNIILHLASVFEESWMVAELLDTQMPPLNTSPGALKIQKNQEDHGLDKALKSLSKTHGLLFLFDKDCPYCEALAPLALDFAHRYGFDLSGLSAGPGSLNGMMCRSNRAAFERLNPGGSVPILLLINPESGDGVPLAQGYVNEQDLKRNARWAIQYLRGRL